MPNLPCLEDEGPFIHIIAVKHFFFYVFEFALRKVVEDEVVFQAAKDKVGVIHGLLFRLNKHILSYSCSDGVDLLLFLHHFMRYVVREQISLGFLLY